jgi:predicted dithiol-disulfide oxidoreductase (DUF899 family)
MRFGRLEGESARYARIRDEIQRAEIDLRDRRERVAALRRTLPLDTVVDDQEFEELRDGAVAPVRLSELFTDPDAPLILMQFMYGKKQEQPCPMCTMWADGYSGVVSHLRRRVNFAVLIAGDPSTFADYARSRGWDSLRVVSAARSDLKRRLGFEDTDGAQNPGVSVFLRRADGSIIHVYSQCALLGEDEFRGMDLLSPVWHYFDLTPAGRGDFFPRREPPA